MNGLKQEELMTAMESLLTTLQCPVCLVLVDREPVLCLNGHATCKKCRGNMSNCPTCRVSFSNLSQNTVFSQILDIIPHPCRFDKCSTIAKAGEDHETYCRYRPTKCELKNCGWIGSVDNLIFHMEDKHPKEKIYSSGSKIPLKFDRTSVDSNGVVSLISACGHYFWQKITVLNQTGKYFSYTPLWIGKPKVGIYIRIWFKSEEAEFDAKIKVKTNKSDLNNTECFLLPNSVVENFYNENKLKYCLLISEGKGKSNEILLE